MALQPKCLLTVLITAGGAVASLPALQGEQSLHRLSHLWALFQGRLALLCNRYVLG